MTHVLVGPDHSVPGDGDPTVRDADVRVVDLIAGPQLNRLADLRKECGLSQLGLAALMDVSQARVSSIERRTISRIEVGTLLAYVEALGGTLRLTVEVAHTGSR